MDAFDQEVKDTRKDWTVETWADEFGFWYAKVSSEVGWGNAGTRDIDRHFGAMRERARRAITREIAQRQAESVGYVRVHVSANCLDSTGVFHSVTFKESGSDD